jgi:Ca-activated chloride channel homolog
MIFDSTLLLFAAPLIAIGLGLAAWVSRRRRLAATTAWSRALGRAARSTGRGGPWLVGVAALAAALALAGPRGGRISAQAQAQALSLVFAVDISRSMLAEDVAPNRLKRAIGEARRLVQDLSQDRLGLIAFAGRSYILTPLTVDGGAVSLYLDGLDPDIASEGGTNLTAVLNQGRDLLEATTEVSDRVLVVFSDGEGHDSLSSAIDAAEQLRDAGIRLILVAEGGPRPVRIPIRDASGTLLEYKLDDNAQVVETRLHEETLRAIADAADGTLVPATLADQAGAVRELVAAWIPALLAGLLLLLQTLGRSGAALVAVAGLSLLPAGAAAQRPSAGARAMSAGDPARAAVAFLHEAESGATRDTAYYNAGTAALKAGRLDVARRALLESARSPDPDLRYRSLYNLGVVGLRAAAQDSTQRDTLLAEAAGHLREALLLAPGSERAKWNLELAERRRPPPPPSGGGGQQPPPPSGGQQPRPPEPRPPERGLTQEQAEQILGSVEREERATRNRQLGRLSGGSGGTKDW